MHENNGSTQLNEMQWLDFFFRNFFDLLEYTWHLSIVCKSATCVLGAFI